MQIVFLGNCQLLALHEIFKRCVAPYHDVTSDYIDANNTITPSAHETISRADIVAVQVADPPNIAPVTIPAGATIHPVPLISGAFLWPYQGVEHPLKPAYNHAYGNPPYLAEYCDRFLAKLLIEGVSPQDALARYKAHDAAAAANVGRMKELTLERQRIVDQATGYDFATMIDTHLAEEQLFQSAFHFDIRIVRTLASELAGRMGFSRACSARIRDGLTKSPFVARWVPVHPSIARHFGLTWVREDTTYPFLWEGSFTFDEYVLRFMTARWSSALQEGVFDASQNRPGARAKLEQGLREAPNSAEGWHALSRIVEREGDLAEAITLQQRAVRCKPDADRLLRLAHLLIAKGDQRRAARLLQQATQVDPMNVAAWSTLRDTFLALDRPKLALPAAEQAAALAPKPEAAENILASLRTRLAWQQTRLEKAPARGRKDGRRRAMGETASAPQMDAKD
jgi:tetratricopeptide (TPR) repeat protein